MSGTRDNEEEVLYYVNLGNGKTELFNKEELEDWYCNTFPHTVYRERHQFMIKANSGKVVHVGNNITVHRNDSWKGIMSNEDLRKIEEDLEAALFGEVPPLPADIFCEHKNKSLRKFNTFEYVYCPDCKKEIK